MLLAGGAGAIGVLEWSNPATIGALPEEHRALNALFESATFRSGGYSTFHQGELGEAALFVAMALMFIGGASGSTAGGIKVNTFSVLLVAIVSTVRGRPSAEAFGRRLPHDVIYRALSVALLSVAFVFAVGLGIEILAGTPFVNTTFEAISAFATVGLTRGSHRSCLTRRGCSSYSQCSRAGLGRSHSSLRWPRGQRTIAYRPAVESMRIG